MFFTQTGGGMEYYGATTTSLRALRHEVFHVYYACSTVARTYRDSWWDEAINMWYELEQWVRACRGTAPSDASFENVAAISETILLGTIAVRVEKKPRWDAAKARFMEAPEADAS